MTWVLVDSSNYKVGCAQQHSIIKCEWFLRDWTSAGPEGTSQFLKAVAQLPTVPMPADHLRSASPHLWPHRTSSPFISWWRKARAWFTDGSAPDAGTPPEVDSYSTSAPSETFMKDSGAGQFSLWGISEQRTWWFTVLGHAMLLPQYHGLTEHLIHHGGTPHCFASD